MFQWLQCWPILLHTDSRHSTRAATPTPTALDKEVLACPNAEDEHGANPNVYLLKYQPEAFGGDGAAAIAMGNPDVPRRIPQSW